MLEKGELLSDADWQNGKYVWFIDCVAPYGHAAGMVRDMQRNIFPNQHYCYAVRRNEDGEIRKITRWCCYRKKIQPNSFSKASAHKSFIPLL